MFLNKLSKIAAEKPVYRFKNAYSRLGADIKPKDNRTEGQIRAAISEMINKNSALEEYKNITEKIEPKYLGLVSDTLELSERHDFLMNNINLNKINKAMGKSPLQALLEVFTKAAKDNPQALDFVQEVINTTDGVTSKYFLCEILDIIDKPETGKFFEAAKPMVKEIAEQTLSGGYLGTLKKQQDFMSFIKLFINPKNDVEKVKLVKKLHDVLEKIPAGTQSNVYLDKFIKSSTPTQRVSKNLDTLKDVAKIAAQNNTEIDVVNFINNNVNLI